MSTARVTAIKVDESYDVTPENFAIIYWQIKAIVEVPGVGALLRNLSLNSSETTQEIANHLRAFADELDPPA